MPPAAPPPARAEAGGSMIALICRRRLIRRSLIHMPAAILSVLMPDATPPCPPLIFTSDIASIDAMPCCQLTLLLHMPLLIYFAIAAVFVVDPLYEREVPETVPLVRMEVRPMRVAERTLMTSAERAYRDASVRAYVPAKQSVRPRFIARVTLSRLKSRKPPACARRDGSRAERSEIAALRRR